MIPSARINATIEILEKVDRSSLNVDRVTASYFRQRRFAGAKDRSFIIELVYRLIRNRIKINWWLKSLDLAINPRSQVIAGLALFNEGPIEDTADLFEEGVYSTGLLDDEEGNLIKELAVQSIINKKMPDNVKYECPDWIADRLRPIYGDETNSHLEALNTEASFDLRLNTLTNPNREGIRKALKKQGLETELTPYSPFGLRANRRQRIDGTKHFKSGLIEVQDEGSQLTALLVGAAPGMQIIDFCTGSGGKALVMGGLMQNTGRIVAMEVSQNRLNQAGIRISRAGLHNIERKLISDESDKKTKRLAKKFDRVLVDAPCTGTGTWRRYPDIRAKYSDLDLENMMSLQDRILASAARLTKPGGCLVYVTCSLLREENEDRITALLSRREDYKIVPISKIWNEQVTVKGGGECPTNLEMLRLTPKEHNTDGFFAAVLMRDFD